MVTNAQADRIEAVQTEFGDGVFLCDGIFQLFQGWACTKYPLPMIVGAHVYDIFNRDTNELQ